MPPSSVRPGEGVCHRVASPSGVGTSGGTSRRTSSLIAVGRKDLQTIQVAIAQQTTQTQVYWGRIFAGSVLASVPVIILFLLLQRYYIKGVVMSGLKG